MATKRTITPITNPQAFGSDHQDEPLEGGGDWRVPAVQANAREAVGLSRDEDDRDDDEATEAAEVRSTTDRLRAALARSGSDSMRVKLYRRERTGALAWCADYTAREFIAGDLELVREHWGPGDYQVRVIGPKGLTMREDLTIARPLERAQANPAAPGADPALAQVLAQLVQGQQAIAAALSQRPDPQAQLQQTLALIASMRDAFAPPPAPAAPTVNPSTMLADIVGAVRQLREVAAEVNPPAADPSDPMAMLPSIIDLVKAGQAQQGQVVPAVALPASMNLPEAYPQPEPAPEPAPEAAAMNPIQKLVLRGLLNRLMTMARAGEAPEKAAAWILEKAPDELIGYLDLDTAVDMLVSVAPEAEEHRAWLETVRQAAVRLLDEDGAEAA